MYTISTYLLHRAAWQTPLDQHAPCDTSSGSLQVGGKERKKYLLLFIHTYMYTSMPKELHMYSIRKRTIANNYMYDQSIMLTLHQHNEHDHTT